MTTHVIPKPDIEHRARGPVFNEKAKELLQALFDGLVHLEEANKDTLTKVDVRLDLETPGLSVSVDQTGTFQVKCESDTDMISVFSPISYGHQYVLMQDEEWKSVLDGHSIKQLLSIEINSCCQGYIRI